MKRENSQIREVQVSSPQTFLGSTALSPSSKCCLDSTKPDSRIDTATRTTRARKNRD